VRCLATVTDEEDAVDVADPRRVNTRIYRVCDVGSATDQPLSMTSARRRARSSA
jgi:hypothetical protein